MSSGTLPTLPQTNRDGLNAAQVPLSVVVVAKNASAKLGDCLRSVAWAEDIVVVDDFSTDDTVVIAREFTDRIFQREWGANEGAQRNFAYAQARRDYILSLDSDERVSVELASELRDLINEGPAFLGYDIPFQSFFGTRQIRFGFQREQMRTRFFKRGALRYDETECHPRVFMTGERSRLKGGMIHLAYDDFPHLISKLNHYSTLEARKWHREKTQVRFGFIMRRMLFRFFKGYVMRQGYHDGWLGVMMAMQEALYWYFAYAKLWEIREQENGRM